ncbi:hypothetical protein [Shimia sp. SK013]|uniref:hypothetical protein n=1 Tax=Shimia sp. SK013 TaxID=1389006 RepID=UPI00128E9D0F|nr:hypothetical protein [Shimia sp. SK013]
MLVRFLLVVLLLSILPMLSVLASTYIASLAGCTLHEGAVNECTIAGLDFGPTLADMFVSGWFFLVTAPVAAAALLGLILMGLIRFGRWVIARWAL